MERLAAFLVTFTESLGPLSKSSIEIIERHGSALNECVSAITYFTCLTMSFPLIHSELEKLSQAIENAQKDRSHGFISFWNTTEDFLCAASFAKRLDTFVADLTVKPHLPLNAVSN
ncbi:MAG TPA: hypothetical protein VGO47_11455 [Chlamydiales bacterium]|nr:hypothetical protein [Chlamydiales bacterium]